MFDMQKILFTQCWDFFYFSDKSIKFMAEKFEIKNVVCSHF